MMRSRLLTFLLIVMLVTTGMTPASVIAEQDLVLVVAEDSRLAGLKPQELRKLFMGLPVMQGGISIKPCRNMADERLNQVFLQKVVYMSERRYEQHLISRVFRIGGVRPKQYETNEQVVRALQEDPNRVSYMWADEARTMEGIKILEEHL